MTSERANWLLFGVIYAFVVLMLLVRLIANADTLPLLADTDDAMRLVVVRDLIAGQGWYDLVQHRLNTPFGAELHWSRLIDAPLAGLMLILRPLFGPMAETVLLVVWPLFLLGLLMAATGALAMTLCGRDGFLPGLVLPVLSPAVISEFVPGRIDHHNVLLILAILLTLLTIRAGRRPMLGVVAGGIAGVGLTLGIEALPMTAAALLAFGLGWVIDGGHVKAMRLFGIGLAGATAIGLVITRPPDRWLEMACDMISASYAGGALLAGAALVALSLLPLGNRSWALRLAMGTGAGVVVAGLLALLFPACLGGPYGAMAPDLAERWLSAIVEAQPVWSAVVSHTDYVIVLALAVVTSLGVTAHQVVKQRGAAKLDWLVLGVFLVIATVMMALQIRGARTAAVLSVPAGAALIGAMRARYLHSQTLRTAGVLIASWCIFSGLALMVLIGLGRSAIAVSAQHARPETTTAAITEPADRRECYMPDSFDALRALPAKRVMAPVDLGAHILAETSHSVVAAPYHRNEQGVTDTFRFFNGPADQGRELLAQRGVTLVVICEALPEMRGFADASEVSLVRLLPSGQLPTWLQEMPGNGVIRIFSVAPEMATAPARL